MNVIDLGQQLRDVRAENARLRAELHAARTARSEQRQQEIQQAHADGYRAGHEDGLIHGVRISCEADGIPVPATFTARRAGIGGAA